MLDNLAMVCIFIIGIIFLLREHCSKSQGGFSNPLVRLKVVLAVIMASWMDRLGRFLLLILILMTHKGVNEEIQWAEMITMFIPSATHQIEAFGLDGIVCRPWIDFIDLSTWLFFSQLIVSVVWIFLRNLRKLCGRKSKTCSEPWTRVGLSVRFYRDKSSFLLLLALMFPPLAVCTGSRSAITKWTIKQLRDHRIPLWCKLHLSHFYAWLYI